MQIAQTPANAAVSTATAEDSVNLKGFDKRFPDPRGITRTPGLLCVDLHDRLHEQNTLLTGSLYRELCRQALLLAARDELGMATRDRALREAFPFSETPTDWPLSLMIQVSRDYVATVTVMQPHKEGVKLLWEQKLTLDREAPYESLLAITERLAREDFRELLLSQGYEQLRAPRSADESDLDPDIEQRLSQWNDISQFAAIRALHSAIAESGESPQRLAALSRGYANLANLTDAYCGPMFKVFTARSLLYAQRVGTKYPEAPEAVWAPAYALCLAGLPQPALRRLEEDAARTEGSDAPPWLAALTSYCRGDLVGLQELAAENQNAGFPVLLLWREARLRNELRVRYQAIADLLEREPDCVRAMFDVPLSGSLGAQASAQLALERISDLTERRLDEVGELPSEVQERRDQLDVDDGATFASLVAELKQAGAPAADTAEPSLDVLGQLLQDAAFIASWQTLNYEQNALAVDVSDRVPELVAWIKGHPYEAAFTARVTSGGAANDGAKNFLKSLKRADMDGWCDQFLSQHYHADRVQAWAMYVAEATHFDQTVPDLFTRLNRRPSDLERQRALQHLQRVAPQLPSTIEAQLQWDASALADELPQIEQRFADDASMLQLLTTAHGARGDTEAAERCARRWIDVSPSYAAWTALAEIRKTRADMPGWIEASEESLNQPVMGLEHASTRSALAAHFLDEDDPQRALRYAELAAQTGASWAMQRAAQVNERLGNLDRASQYQEYIAQRYSDEALNWAMWCLRTGGGDLDEALKVAKFKIREFGPEASDDDQTRAALVAMTSDDWASAYKRMLPVGRRSTEPFFVWFTVMLADSQDATAERSELLQRVVTLATAGEKANLAGTSRIAEYLDRQLTASPESTLDVALLDREIAQLGPDGMTNLWYFLSEILRHHGQEAEAQDYLRRAARSPQPNLWTQFLASHFLRAAGETVDLRKYEFIPPVSVAESSGETVLQTDRPVIIVRLLAADRALIVHQDFDIAEWRVGEKTMTPWGKARGLVIDLTPDGSRALVVPEKMRSCEVWTRDGEKPEKSLSTSAALLRAARFLPDDPDHMACLEFRNASQTAVGCSLCVRNLATGADEWRVDLGNRVMGGIYTAAPDRSILVTGYEGSVGWIGQYRASDGKEIRLLSIPNHPIDRLSVAANGERAATLSRFGEIRIWDLVRMEPIHRLWSHGTSHIVISADGSRLATANGRTARVYDLSDGSVAADILDHLQPVAQVAFDPAGQTLATCSGDMTVRVYRLAELQPPAKPQALPAFEVVNSLGMTFVPIPAGEFLMGERDKFEPGPGYKTSGIEHERPRHPVTLTQPYYLSQFETTLGQFRKFVDATGYVTDLERNGGGRHAVPPNSTPVRRAEFTWRNPGFVQDDESQPVLQITWNDAKQFCEWLSKTEGKNYRLPTEAEWEYACRAGSNLSYTGTNTATPDTTGFNNSADVAIADLYDLYYGVAYWDDKHPFAAPVGRFRPNAWGLFDMHGNAYEWCSDTWDPDYYSKSSAVDPVGPPVGESRVQRGGSFLSHPDDARSAHRAHARPDDADSTSGFRIVLEVRE